MFNDRDLGILGAGALLAVLCLFLPVSFVGKVILGFLVLVIFMAIALLRLGPDRVPSEVWLMRRWRYARQNRKYVNQQAPTRTTQNAQKQKPESSASSAPAQTVIRPVDLAWDEVGVYPLLTVLLGVLGVYFAVWLARGGAAELSIWFK
ncbi:MAG: PrgI family protein [Chloroflexi bacterium]|nr:PrgI family protein [Chloroflexota bacterium]